MYKLMLIAFAGAAGTLARYGMQSAVAPLSERFPCGTLAVNLSGCLLIGLLGALLEDRLLLRPEHRVAILVGFLGAYTTFSTFGWETTSLLRDGQFWWGALNVLAHNVIGILAVIAGYAIGVKL